MKVNERRTYDYESSHNLNGEWQKINFSLTEMENELKLVENLKNIIGFVSPSNGTEEKNLSAVYLPVEEAIRDVKHIVTEIFVCFLWLLNLHILCSIRLEKQHFNLVEHINWGH
jgi:hypothetical protein